jgi:DNA-binding response OmpR family regulator/signal transduction histidine kinase
MRDRSPKRPSGLAPRRLPTHLPGAHRFSQSGLIAFVLLAAGALPPAGLVALPGGLPILEAPRTGIVLIMALVFAPALVWVAVALQGFDTVLARLRAALPGEYPQLIARVSLGALVFGFVLGLLAAQPEEPAIPRCLLIGSLLLAVEWLVLLQVILDPRDSQLLRYVALISDIVLFSILLAAGGGLTAALAPIYLCVVINSTANRHGPLALACAVLLGAIGFAVMALVTPFWREERLLAGGMLVAIATLPLYVGALLRRLGAAKTRSEAAIVAKDQLLAALGEDLRRALRTITRAGSHIDRAGVDPEHWDTIAQMRLNARAMLLELGDIPDYREIDDDAFAPGTRSFDLHDLASGAVAALRVLAAECDIDLAVRVDPRLPYQLCGRADRLRQILIGLATNAMRFARRARVGINMDAAASDDARVTLRVAVVSDPRDNQLETADQTARSDEAGQRLGLAVVEQLVALMGGRLVVDTERRRGLSLVVELPFAVDRAVLALPPDLAHLPVLIISKDAELAGELSEPLEAWRADPRWIGAGDAALTYLARLGSGDRRTVLVVDGRGDVLQALSWTQRAAVLAAWQSAHVIFIADEPRVDSIVGLAGGELDSILPAPVTADMLRNALHSFRAEPTEQFPEAPHSTIAANLASPLHRQVAEARLPSEPIDLGTSPRSPAPIAAAVRSKRRWQVLIATSNASNRRIMGSMVRRAGHEVLFGATLDEVRRELEAHEIDVLLLDLTGAPGADYEAARLCRRARPSLTIIALTGDDATEAERRAREIGLDAVLVKPVEPRRLLAAIDAAMGGEPVNPAPSEVVTQLSSHPRFVAEANSPVDHRQSVASRSPGESSALFQGMIDTFRTASRRIVSDMAQAALAGDTQAFEAGLRALRDCTANFGVGRLRDLLQSLHGQSSAVLRRQGADYVQRLQAELARLDAVLVERLRIAN